MVLGRKREKGEVTSAKGLRACGQLADVDEAARRRVASCGLLTAGICKGRLFSPGPITEGVGGTSVCYYKTLEPPATDDVKNKPELFRAEDREPVLGGPSAGGIVRQSLTDNSPPWHILTVK